MKRDLIKGIKLIPFGVSIKSSIVLFILFMALGIGAEIVMPMGVAGQNYFNYGAMFIFAGMMFPGQILLSDDVSLLVQTSPYKKKIQVSMQTYVSLIMNLIGMTITLIIYGVHRHMHPEYSVDLMKGMLYAAAIGVFVSTVSTLLYKYFFTALIVIYIVAFSSMYFPMIGFGVKNCGLIESIVKTPALTTLICYLLMFVGAAGNYVVSTLLYKKEFSKMAFSAALKRN